LAQRTAKYGENASENADLYFAYGKALLENAITQSSVLGKNQTEGAINNDEPGELNPTTPKHKPLTIHQSAASSSGAFLSFSGDAEDEDDEDEVKEDTTESKPAAKNGDDDAVDLFAEASRAVEAEEAAAAENDEDYEDEPEDDFNAAWEVLDLARALYDKQKDTDNEIKLKLADTYICLGDISLETGKCSIFF
jgi:HAT1-interacting factor 1